MKFLKLTLALSALGLNLTACTDCGPSEVVKNYTDYELNGVVLKNGVYTDRRDNQTYKVVKLGADYWFAENLRYAGVPSDSNNYELISENSWCHSEALDSCDVYGRLYTFEAATQACPEGWRLPSTRKWVDMLESINGNTIPWFEYSGVALKSLHAWDYVDSIPQPTNRYGFNALPAGRHNIEGGELPLGKYAYFWAYESLTDETATGFTLMYDSPFMDQGKYYKKHGMSVRCVVDTYDYYSRVTEDGPADSSYLEEIPKYFGTLEYKGQEYKTVILGGYEIMAENMNAETEHSWCVNNEPANCEKYGRLYSEEDAETVCPEGWALMPETFFYTPYQMESALLDLGVRNLKDTLSWKDGTVGHDEWGFSLQAAGGYDINSKTFYDLGFTGYLWLPDTKVIEVDYADSTRFAAFTAPQAFPVRCYNTKHPGYGTYGPVVLGLY